MSRIFISYRREDTAGYAGRLFDRLAEAFGRDSVFMDVDTLGAGVDFAESIRRAVGSCDVFIALIGKRWLAVDKTGRPRLDDEGDFVRLEIASALEGDHLVIPVQVDGAAMPEPGELPEALAPLCGRNAVELSNTRWDADVSRLIAAIREAGVAEARVPFLRQRLGGVPVWLAALALALAGAAGIAYRQLTAPPQELTPPTGAFIPEEVAIRPAVAVLGFKDTSGPGDYGWISTALAEALVTELAAGNQVRVPTGDTVAAALRDLELVPGEEPSASALEELRGYLRVDTVVGGSYVVLGSGDNPRLRVELRMWDALTGELRYSAGPSGEIGLLPELVIRAGEGLRRDALGIGDLTPAAVQAVRDSLPKGIQATRFYAEGLQHRRLFDDRRARALLEEAVALDAKHALSQSELARALWNLGLSHEARGAALTAQELAETLEPKEREAIRAFALETQERWEEAAKAYETLFLAFPDDIDLGVKLAFAQTTGERLTEALIHIGNLRRLPEPLSLDPRIDYAEARIRQVQGDYDTMLELARGAAQDGRELGADALVAESLLLEAIGLQEVGSIEDAEVGLREAKELFDGLGDRNGVARVLEIEGHGESQLGRSRVAERLWSQAEAIYRETGNDYGAARILEALALTLQDTGRLTEAAKAIEKALEVYRQLGLENDQAVAISNLGYTAQLQGELAEAAGHYETAMGLFDKLGARADQALTRTNLAEIYYTWGDLDEARRLHEESLGINEEIDDEFGQAYDNYRLALVLMAQGDLEVARSTLEKAIEDQLGLEDEVGAAEYRIHLARLDLAEGRADDAASTARTAEQTLRNAGEVDPAALAKTVLGHALLNRGSLDAARVESREAAALAAASEDAVLRFASAVLAARVRAAGGGSTEASAALTELAAIRDQAERDGYLAWSFEARLARGEIQSRSDARAAAEAELTSLRELARAGGFGLYEQLAVAALADDPAG